MAQKISLQGSMTLTAANKITRICKPLKSIGVDFFRYMKLFNDGSRIILTNQPSVMQYYYEEGNYETTWHDNSNPASAYQSRCNIWAIKSLANSIDQKQLEQNLRKFFNLTQGVAYIFKQVDSLELFDFSDSDFHVYDINPDIYRRFMFYFKEQAYKIIRDAHYEKIRVPITKSSSNCKTPNEEQLIKSMPIKKYHLNGNLEGKYLTCREVNCINWCVKGKSAEEIAILLGTSKKTIERHMENIKQKLNCTKQSQLIRLAISQGIVCD